MIDLTKLEKLSENGDGGWTCSCPAHDDRKPSLSLKITGDKTLWKCHAGCSQQAVLKALKAVGALPVNGRPKGGLPTQFRGDPIIAIYDYHDADGALLYCIARTSGKEFPIWSRGSWGLKGKGVSLVPYRLPQILKAEFVFIVEGEKDVATLEKMGLAATTSPGGAGKWRSEFAEHFEGRRVAIIPDNDSPGRQHAEHVAASLSGKAASVKILELRGLPKGGDISDWAEAKDPIRAGRCLSILAARAPEFEPPRERVIESAFTLTRLGDLLAEPEEEHSWLVEGLLPSSGFSILTAKPKVGKSTLARCLALAVARGWKWLDHKTNPGAVFYLALEEKRAEVRAHFRRMGGCEDDPIFVYVASAPEDAIESLEMVVRRERPALVIVDSLFRLARIRDGNGYAEVTAALEPILNMARNTGSHVLVTHHNVKGNRGGGDEVLGSTALFGSVDTLLSMKRTDRFRTIYSINRYGTDLPESVLEMDPETGWVRALGSRKDAEQEAAARIILEFLESQSEAVSEREILEQTTGTTLTLQNALRRLVDDGRAIRTGEGKRGSPFLYRSSARFQDEIERLKEGMKKAIRDSKTTTKETPSLHRNIWSDGAM